LPFNNAPKRLYSFNFFRHVLQYTSPDLQLIAAQASVDRRLRGQGSAGRWGLSDGDRGCRDRSVEAGLEGDIDARGRVGRALVVLEVALASALATNKGVANAASDGVTERSAGSERVGVLVGDVASDTVGVALGNVAGAEGKGAERRA
jgi:hypothetical protein